VAAIDFHGLGEVIWVSLVAGVGVTVLYSLVVFGAGKAGEARRRGQAGPAAAFTALSVVAMLVFSATVILAITVMLNKE
jgi:hypothetical protein